MTSGEPASDDDADGSEFVRPSLTIKERHDKLLDELQDARYGSRSEAVRAAIEALAKSVMDDGEAGIEQISKQVGQLGAQIDELAGQIDELQEQRPTSRTTNFASQSKNTGGPSHDVPTVEATESQGSAELQGEIYTLLSEQGPMSVPEIAEHVDEDLLNVHESITQLVENRDFVTQTNQADTPRYKIKQLNSN